jgi:hypothetical protein
MYCFCVVLQIVCFFCRSVYCLCVNVYCTVLYCTVLYCTVLYCTVLHCTVVYCTVLYCSVLYCTVLYYCHRLSTQLQLTNISISTIARQFLAFFNSSKFSVQKFNEIVWEWVLRRNLNCNQVPLDITNTTDKVTKVTLRTEIKLISQFHHAFQITMCNRPTNALVCNKILIQMSYIKTLKITPTCFDPQLIIVREPLILVKITG